MVLRFFSVRFAAIIAVLLLTVASCQAGYWQVTYGRSGSDSRYVGEPAYFWNEDPGSFQFTDDGFLKVSGNDESGYGTSTNGTVYMTATWIPSYPGDPPTPVDFEETITVVGTVLWEENVYSISLGNPLGGIIESGFYGGVYQESKTATRITTWVPGTVEYAASRGVFASVSSQNQPATVAMYARMRVISRQ